MKTFKRSKAIGFFDEDIKLTKLSRLGDPLERISKGIDFELTLRYKTLAIGAYFEKVNDRFILKMALHQKRREENGLRKLEGWFLERQKKENNKRKFVVHPDLPIC